MRKECVDCPGGNLFRKAGEPVQKNGRLCLPVYVLDYDFLPAIDQIRNVKWLVHEAINCRDVCLDETPLPNAPNGIWQCEPFPYHAPVPLLSDVGEQVVIDGIHCRVDFMRMSRLRKVGVNETIPSPFVL